MSDYLGSIVLNQLSSYLVLEAKEKTIVILLTDDNSLVRDLGKKIQQLEEDFDDWAAGGTISKAKKKKVLKSKDVVRQKDDFVAFALGKWLKDLSLSQLSKLCDHFNIEISVKVEMPDIRVKIK